MTLEQPHADEVVDSMASNSTEYPMDKRSWLITKGAYIFVRRYKASLFDDCDPFEIVVPRPNDDDVKSDTFYLYFGFMIARGMKLIEMHDARKTLYDPDPFDPRPRKAA